MLKINRLKSAFCAGVAVMGLIALPGALFAEEATTAKETKPVQPVEAPKPASAVSGDAGINFVSAYFSRGILQENQGTIAQPYADLYFSLYEDTGFVNKVVAQMGIWASAQSHHPGVVSSIPSWYEFDWMPGLAVTFAKNFTLTASYFEFDSPTNSFIPSNTGIPASARSVNINLAYSDTDLLGAFALHPHVTFLKEIKGAAGLSTGGNYFEVGIAPGLPAFGPVTVTLPVIAGFGSNGFYALTTQVPATRTTAASAIVTESKFGYVSAGPNFAVALPFPARYGAWTFNAAATYYRLNGTVATADVGRKNDCVFSGGVGVTF